MLRFLFPCIAPEVGQIAEIQLRFAGVIRGWTCITVSP